HSRERSQGMRRSSAWSPSRESARVGSATSLQSAAGHAESGFTRRTASRTPRRSRSSRLSRVPNVLADPAPTVEILESNLAGPVLCANPHCHNEHYWQVYFDTNRLIRETFGEAGFPAPEQLHAIRTPVQPAQA